MAGISRGGGARATRRATARGRSAPIARIPNSSAQSGSAARGAATAAPGTPQRRPRRPERPSSHGPPRDRDEGILQFGDQRREWPFEHDSLGDDHERHAGRRGIARHPKGLAQPAPRAIPRDRSPDLSGHSEPRAPRTIRLAPQHDERRTINTLALPKERLNFGAGGQPLAAGESAGYTVSRLRPFARRRLSTFRPPFVFIRSRKPCVLARRRRFG